MIRIAEILKKSASRENERDGRTPGREASVKTDVNHPAALPETHLPTEERKDDRRSLWDLWEWYQQGLLR